MITTADLRTHSKADLARMAKRFGVPGWSSMRKDELVAEVAKASKSSVARKKQMNGHAPGKQKSTTSPSRANTKSVAGKSAARKSATASVAAVGKSQKLSTFNDLKSTRVSKIER